MVKMKVWRLTTDFTNAGSTNRRFEETSPQSGGEEDIEGPSAQQQVGDELRVGRPEQLEDRPRDELVEQKVVAAAGIAGAEDEPTYQRMAKWGDLTHNGHGDTVQGRITNENQLHFHRG